MDRERGRGTASAGGASESSRATGATKTTRLGAAGVAGAAALWGLWPFWVRHAGVGGARVATLALLAAAVFGLPFALAEPLTRKPRRALILLALLGVSDAANAWTYFRALAEGAVAPAVLSHYLAPVLVALAAPAVLGEPRGRRTPVALVLAAAGTAAIMLSGRHAGGRVLPAVLLGGLSAIFYAANVLLSKKAAPHFGNAQLMSWHSIIAVVVLAPATGLPPLARWPWPILGGVVSTLVAGIIYYVGLRRIPAERAGVLTYVEPVVAVLVGWIAFAEVPPLTAALGGALVLGGGVLVATDS
jgi:drug/metabolite transporter (DMT)-like permease